MNEKKNSAEEMVYVAHKGKVYRVTIEFKFVENNLIVTVLEVKTVSTFNYNQVINE